MPLLFLNDWKKYPNAIVDTETPNKTFLEYAIKLKDFGIRNHAWPLALLNPRLQGVDPLSPDLTHEEIAMITVEAKLNPIYILREILRAPPKAGTIPVQFRANRSNMSLFWLFFNHVTVILIQIRQTGKSFGFESLMSILLNTRCVNTEINLLTRSSGLKAETMERLKDIIDGYPDYLKQRKKNDVANSDIIRISNLNNRFKAHLSSSSPKDARKVGRGFSSAVFGSDEPVFTPNIAEALPAALQTGNAAREMARAAGEPYGVILTTTTGELDNKDAIYVYNLVQRMAPWTERFLDCEDEDELRRVVMKASSGKPKLFAVNCTFNHRQLGYTDEWLMDKIRDNLATADTRGTIRQDLFNEWGRGHATSPIPKELCRIISDSTIHDLLNSEIYKGTDYTIRWYLKNPHDYLRNHSVILTIDPSELIGRDDTSVIFMDVKSGGIIGAANINEGNIITFTNWIADWVIDFPKLLLIIERKSQGPTMIDLIIIQLVAQGIDPFRRMFNRIASDPDKYQEQYKEISKPMHSRMRDLHIRWKEYIGFPTTGSGSTSRSLLYGSVLLSAAKMIGSMIRDKMLADQILGLQMVRGRVDHPDGDKDDLAIAAMIAFWLLTMTKNLSYYGIDSFDILSNNPQRYDNEIKVDPITHREQLEIRNEIETVYNQLCNERDRFIITRLENRLRSLASRLVLYQDETFSLDELLSNARKSKQLNRFQ